MVISAPTHLHSEIGIAAARARKHIYLETPVAMNAAGARKLAEAVRAAGILVAVGFNRRCHPLYLEARDLITAGAVGGIRSVSSTFNEPVPDDAMPAWKRIRATGGGVLLDLASHHADLLRWFLNDEVAEVDAQIRSRVTEDDEAWMRVTMRSGARVQSYFSFRAGRADFIEFMGEHGVLRVDRHRSSLSLRVARRFGYGVRSKFVRPTLKVLMVSDYKLVCPIGSKLLPDGSLCHHPAGLVCTRNGCLSLPHWLRDQPRYALIRSAVKKSDRILACSRSVQRELAEAGLKSEVLYLSAPARPLGFVRRPSAEPRFLFCGRLEVEKGVDLLIRVFSRLRREFPTTRLVVAGRGAKRSKLENLVGSLGVAESVDFLGWMSPRQLERPWSHAWASVVPSVWAEPQGLVAVEAIIRGVPVISSSAGGLGEIVEHGVSGLLFPNNDEEALLNCLRIIATGSAFAEHTLADEVVRKAEVKFSMGSHIESMRRVFAEAIQEAAS